jgi:hypothetical protein
MALAAFGAVGVFFTGFLVPRREAVRRSWPVVLAGALVGAAAGVAVPTDYDKAAGRWSGLWHVTRAFPTVAHRSPPIVALAAVGGAVLAAWWAALPRRDGWVFAAAFLAFTAAHTATHEAYQRYYEPWALVLFALAASRLAAGSPDGHSVGWAAIGPVVLALALAGVSVLSL